MDFRCFPASFDSREARLYYRKTANDLKASYARALLYTVEKEGWWHVIKRTIEKNLIKALLNDGAMEYALFEYELKEHIDEYLKSKHEDGDDYFFAVTEHTNDVAMLLIDKKNKVHVNEKARAMLKKYWNKSAYEHNMRILIPQMVDQLSNGYLFVSGVKIQQSSG